MQVSTDSFPDCSSHVAGDAIPANNIRENLEKSRILSGILCVGGGDGFSVTNMNLILTCIISWCFVLCL